LLSGISKTCKVGFSGAPTKPRSDIYITIDDAFLPRHALLSRSAGSATPLSNQMTGSNLQITLEVRKPNGDRVENCIYSSSNSEPASVWESTATERGDSVFPRPMSGALICA
jgi:dedicator of cytokinesis protein 3